MNFVSLYEASSYDDNLLFHDRSLTQARGARKSIRVTVCVGDPAARTVPAGRFDAVYIYRTVQLDDAEAWRSRTSRRDTIWYAPTAKAPVREEREAEYTQRSGRDPPVRTESTLLELLSFQPGGK